MPLAPDVNEVDALQRTCEGRVGNTPQSYVNYYGSINGRRPPSGS